MQWLLVGSLLLGGAAKLPKPIVEGMKNPESVVVAADGRTYITAIGEFGKPGDGAVLVIDKSGKAVPFASGLDDPKGIAAFGDSLFVADNDRVLRIELKGAKVNLFAPPNAFPHTPLFLNDVAVDPESGTVFVSDSGNLKGEHGAVFRISPKGLVDIVADSKRVPGLSIPNGLALDGASHLLILDFGTGFLHRLKLATQTAEKLAEGFEGGDGLIWDKFGRLFITSWKQGKAWVIAKEGEKPLPIAEGFESAADLCLDSSGRNLLIPDMKAGTLVAIPAQVPGAPVDFTPLPLEISVAFPKLKWTGWEGEDAKGLPVPFRAILLTHAGDGSNRVFVPSQQGVIHVFANEEKAQDTKVFLDLRKKVRYDDKQNEEGFLGLAFPKDYKKSGQFYAFYTLQGAKHPHTNIVCRYRVSKDDPNKADPDSEEELLRFERPFWNHDGGTIAFGPDGMLYVALGDGGAANDLYHHAQNLSTLHGSVLRIDVSKKDPGLPYAIPADNPFVGKKDVRAEIWAAGLRNVWRFSFDRKTGDCWAADVGQNLYEEINLLKAGGNYGWNYREGLHPFGARGVGPRKDYIEPIWEYHHDIGRSITGGHVYRGKALPQLEGRYVYADYVSGTIWALKYDDKEKRVVANQTIRGKNFPILSFGEDEAGEVYATTYNASGQVIYRFVPTTK